jgi:hypothetical protein
LQEQHLTAETIRKLLAALPVGVIKKIQKLSKETGASVETIVGQGVELYRKRATAKMMRGNDELARIMNDPTKRAIFDEITNAMGKRSSNALTPEQRAARTSAGGTARAKNLTPERRKEIAAIASEASARKRAEKRKLAEAGGSSKP